MTIFLLVVTFMMSNGQKGVSIEKFDTSSECYRALVAIGQEVPNVTATCSEIKRGE